MTLNKRVILILLLIVLIAYGQTLFMYFWQDDSALIFRLQHPVGAMGSFGPSIWLDRGAYRYMVIPFVPFYQLFGLEPLGYFIGGVLTYLLATIVFWIFVKQLFKNNKLALISSMLFAAGFIGSDMMFRIINSWQSNIGLILSLLSLYFYTKYINESCKKYYFFSLLFFFASIELVYIRSHSLVFSIIILELVFAKLKFLKRTVLRLLPFIIMFYFWYFRDPNFGSPKLPEITMLTSFFASVGNSLVPNIISQKISPELFLVAITGIFAYITNILSNKKIFILISILGNITLFCINFVIFKQDFFWYKEMAAFTQATIGLLMVFNIILTAIFGWKRKDKIGQILLIGLVLLLSQIFGYFMQYPTAIFVTTHRYLYFAFIGYSIVYISLFSLFRKRFLYLFASSLILINLSLSLNYQITILKDRSIPTREFYQTLLKYVPKIDKGSIFYFDIKEESYYQRQFGDFFSVGSMPESTALAIYYGLDRDDILFLTNFDELISILSKNPEKINHTYAFYYGDSGLVNQTNNLRTLSSFPGLFELKFDAKVDIDNNKLGEINKINLNSQEKESIFSYLNSKKQFYIDSKASSLSEWKFQEVKNILDNNLETSWRGHRIYWDDNEHDSITIDMKSVKTINRFVWTNWIPSLTPTTYTIEVSEDGINWKIVARVGEGQVKGPNQKVEEEFLPVQARFIKMDITSTLTNDSPAISEVEAIEASFGDLVLNKMDEFLNSPFTYVNNPPPQVNYINIEIETDKGMSFRKIPIEQFNNGVPYIIYLPLGGTLIKNINFEVDDPLLLKVNNYTLNNLNINQMQKLNLIKDFSIN